MNYRELLQRIEDEGLCRYGGILPGSFHQGENCMNIYQNPDGTIDIAYMGDRGSVISEKLGLPEEEGCMEAYKCAMAEFEIREMHEQYKKEHPTKLVHREITVVDSHGVKKKQWVWQEIPADE